MKQKNSILSSVLLITAGLAIIASIFLPIWRIELDAPQYPEGLYLQIFSNKLGGQVEIVNGLNHYIGMKTLHKEDFIEFTVLPYILGFFALWAFAVAVIRRRKWSMALLLGFLTFGILAMVDFWMWEYDYGHNLDPNAAIKVPGMSYQPPLIGFKQLLNFGAYSIPDIGGWLIVAAGLLMLCVVALEFGWLKRFGRKTAVLFILFGLAGCTDPGPQPIQINKDMCAACKMTIADARFASQFVTKKGRSYKFDDINCMAEFAQNFGYDKIAGMYCSNFNPPHQWLVKDSLTLVYSEEIRSPMNSRMAAFPRETDQDKIGQLWPQYAVLKADEVFK